LKFDDLDYFCSAYKAIFAKAVPPLKKEIARLAPRLGSALQNVP
jgi:hypothetical protein